MKTAIVALSLVLLAAAPAQAGMGACEADDHDGLVCGSGIGAARVIDGTISPDKRMAFAWRDSASEISEHERDDTLELLVVRLSDGAILAKSTTTYWDTGEIHVNRLREEASWSPDGRLAVRAFQDRFDTPTLGLFAFGAKDAAAGTFDLRKLVEPAAVQRLRRDVGTAAAKYSFSVDGGDKIKLGNNGAMIVPVMMWVPKEGPYKYYDITVQVARKTAHKGGAPSARIASIKPGKARD